MSDPDEEMFRVLVADGLIRLGRETALWMDDERNPHTATTITVSVYGSHGREVAEAEYHSAEHLFAEANTLFEMAKVSARNSYNELDNLLQALSK